MALYRRYVWLLAVFLAVATVAAPDERPSSHGIWPMGWSDDGAFAYAKVESFGDPCPSCYKIELAIIDLVTDKRLWSYRDSDDYDEFDTSVEETLQTYGEITARPFEKFAIDTTQPGRLETGTQFRGGGLDYSVEVFNEREEREIRFQTWEGTQGTTIIDAVVASRVVISSPTLGEKTILSFEVENSEISSAEIVAVVINPAEDRGVILFQIVYGDPFISSHTRISLIGALFDIRIPQAVDGDELSI